MPRPTVVFDFDGTLALGRGPLDAYARALAEHGGETVVADCLAAVGAFDAGETNFDDAYDAVASTARSHGVTEQQLSLAYLASRELVATDAAPIHAPAGLPEFMTELAEHAICVLATNAPATGIEHALTVLGVRHQLTEVDCSVGKPAGLKPIVARHLATGHVLCVGDRWDNDLEPGHVAGAAIALVGVTDPGEHTPTMRGASLVDLYDDILRWAASDPGSTPAPLGAGTRSERH
ncbi:HAD family hydrolase [Pseudactinotalea sp.]|uniref:HAD family hydrolase n=1 Tax=Pseudactinotalea sp. TaxID=1926260 RepID=UPI003B3AFC63